jgi:hypothetical protein
MLNQKVRRRRPENSGAEDYGLTGSGSMLTFGPLARFAKLNRLTGVQSIANVPLAIVVWPTMMPLSLIAFGKVSYAPSLSKPASRNW